MTRRRRASTPDPVAVPWQFAFGSRRRRWWDRSVAPGSNDRERQRHAATFLLPDISMAGPPFDRVLRDALQAKPRAEQRRHDLAERPGPGELPTLIVLVDREPVDVLGCPAL